MRPLSVLTALTFAIGVAAHKATTTPEEKAVEQALKEAIFRCTPEVSKFTLDRQKSWFGMVTGVGTQLPGYEDLFANQETLEGAEKKDDSSTFDLACTVSDTARNQQYPFYAVPSSNHFNHSCVLTPEVTEGPYYNNVTHPIRQNIAELQGGLLTYLDIGVIDVETCKPLPNVLVDIWHANATGHYSGHPVPAPEHVNEEPQVGGARAGLLSQYPRTKPEQRFLRGAWATDSTGVARFTTIFPGYYTGRALHVHTKVWTEWEVLANGSFAPGKLSHTGQFFFEDEIGGEIVDKMHPYTENPIAHTRGRTRNWRDSLNVYGDSHGNGYNPVFDLHLLGGVLSQGVIGFITMGINASASYDNFWKGGVDS
ncbi:aromatic compound dioxygenase [Fistulina hepatica ATCC 64428]|uniref:Aromatic compound dioxygenase n=1 Tax=Fistulina hepatica ATCC 64428 TaxID=1128425 RepID=A0A0D7AJU3_9AGAR|nr:aromatic compound dioxygenase [Fistulina hepatica ATCC 64428]